MPSYIFIPNYLLFNGFNGSVFCKLLSTGACCIVSVVVFSSPKLFKFDNVLLNLPNKTSIFSGATSTLYPFELFTTLNVVSFFAFGTLSDPNTLLNSSSTDSSVPFPVNAS